MRLGVIAQQQSSGGGQRFLAPLLRALVRADPSVDITVFVNRIAIDSFDWAGRFSGVEGITIVSCSPDLLNLPYRPPVGVRQKVFHAATSLAKVDRPSRSRRAAKWLSRQLATQDVVYAAWPYYLSPIIRTPPLVATFHDFNFKHEFGVFDEVERMHLELELAHWMSCVSIAVASSDFIRDEGVALYPSTSAQWRTIRLSSFVTVNPDWDEVHRTLRKYGVDAPYVVCPSNVAAHKNLERLIEAFAKVRRATGHKLVLVGSGTNFLGDHHSTSVLMPLAEQRGLQPGVDVLGLGYVPDRDVEAIIKGASILVAPSLYEAGSGPAVDAWMLGTPVAFSNIRPFAEHLEHLGVQAFTFDPRDSNSIAKVIVSALADSPRRATMAEVSRAAMTRHSWDGVAVQYLTAFRDAGMRGAKHQEGANIARREVV